MIHTFLTALVKSKGCGHADGLCFNEKLERKVDKKPNSIQ